MKKLPKIYKNEINKNIKNNKEYCYLDSLTKEDEASIREKIDSIFNGMGYSYNIPVTVKTKDREYKTSLVAKTKNNLITLDNDTIKISDIITLDIK